MDPSVSYLSEIVIGWFAARPLPLLLLLAHLFPSFTFVWSYTDESAGSTGCDIK